MNCPKCNYQLVESTKPIKGLNNIFFQEYFCFNCFSLFECTSQSGDMVEEYLIEIED